MARSLERAKVALLDAEKVLEGRDEHREQRAGPAQVERLEAWLVLRVSASRNSSTVGYTEVPRS